LGSWVNIGAMATTSDLKNNYGFVNIKVPKEFYPIGEIELTEVPTSKVKFGSIIGDCVKVSIGTMINTGSVFDFGCNIFDGTLKYMPPLSWGKNGDKYNKKRFFSDCETIFERRNQKPHLEFINMIDRL
jgi:glucose-1-phosphate thymidylyltransferase